MEKLDRSSLYESIKALNLQEKVKEIYGKNFTQVSSAELKKLIDEEEKLINVASISNTVEEEPEEELSVESVEELEKQREEQEEKKEEPKEEKAKSIKDESKLIQAVIKLVTKLRQIRVISESDANHILGEL